MGVRLATDCSVWTSTTIRVEFNGYRAEPARLHLRPYRKYSPFNVAVPDSEAMARYKVIPSGTEIEVQIFALFDLTRGTFKSAELRELWMVDDVDGSEARRLWSEWWAGAEQRIGKGQ